MKSWIDSANLPQSHFPIQNLPMGAARFEDAQVRCVCAIGDYVVDLALLETHRLLGFGDQIAKHPVFNNPNLNAFMALGPDGWEKTRNALSDLLAKGGNPVLKNHTELRRKAIISMSNVEMQMPIQVAEFTDFYAGRHHATNVGTMFRGAQNALPPNWLHLPIGYNGRSSTVVVSGTPVRRPLGQLKPPTAEFPYFGPSKRLDMELELGAVIGVPSQLGRPVTVAEADAMIFGYVLLNDWSARDIQAWEYQPLGPFQAKAFATSISPWIVTRAALEGFRAPTPEREEPLLPYLQEPGPMLYDINLEASLLPSGGNVATTLTRTNYATMYYSSAQQLAHHASSGCKMNIADLLGSGTISGADQTAFGSLLELSWGGKNPITLDTGETRTFIEDGDTIRLTGWAQGDGYKIGFGTCTGEIIPALKWPDE